MSVGIFMLLFWLGFERYQKDAYVPKLKPVFSGSKYL